MSCDYMSKGFCTLLSRRCRKTNNDSIEKCKTALSVKDNVSSENIYKVRKDIICNKCGCNTAYQYLGKLYPKGLSKVSIKRNPEIYGKYYNRPYLSGAIGFGGTIPFECGNCGTVGLIDMELEGYKSVFTAKKQEDS